MFVMDNSGSRENNLQRLLSSLILFLVLAGIIYTYLPSIQKEYLADDYLLLTQGMRHGFLKSLIIPFKGHFIPLFRFVMQGSHLIFGHAAPMHALILTFHLLNTVLIFRIVRRLTDSSLLSCIASFTFGISFQAAGCVLWVIAGVWVISLTFILFMYIWFEKFLEEDYGAQTGACVESAWAGNRGFRNYYIGLLFFALALGFFTIAAFAGLLLWLFLYLRLLQSKGTRTSFRFHFRFITPFFLVLIIYLVLRAYLNYRFLPLQDHLFQAGSAIPAYRIAEQINIIKSLPPAFYVDFFRRLAPYFPDHYIAVLVTIILLLLKELIVRPEKAKIAATWLLFAGAISAIPVFGRVSFARQLSGSAQYILPWWYFYYPVAGISSALGILLSPPHFAVSLTKSSLIRTTFAVSVITILVFINAGKISEIRTEAHRLTEENRRFDSLVRQYAMSMQAFLTSPAYSAECKYIFPNMPAADKRYPAGWSVMQNDIFLLLFPNIENISFIDRSRSHEFRYIWTPAAVMQRRTSFSQ